MSPLAWTRCLDALTDHLVAQRTALAEDRPEDITPFSPAAGLGPLPDSLRERAVRLAADSARLEAELAAALNAGRRQLKLVNALQRPSTPASSSYVDSHC